MNNKIINILESIVVIALGIIVAVCGGGEALDIYFAIICLVGGVALFILATVGLAKTKALDLSSTLISGALIAVGIALFTPYLSFSALINLVVVIIIGFGAALVLFGIYALLIAKNALFGIGQILVGAVAIVMAVLFITVREFEKVFWIIAGILIIIYGVLSLVTTLIDKKAK